MYLRVRPDSLDHAASGLAALAKSMPQAQLIRRDLEAVGACLPGFAAGSVTASSASASVTTGTEGDPWGQSVAALRTALLGHGGDLGRSAQGYRDVDAGLSATRTALSR
ncbi:MAG: hypothetical protein IPH27_12105 [Actinomycetales bacterium]|nr:hypothetical protein [Candidatus Phosphoribacter baldrii]